jgi:hypothetical protein
VAATALHKSTHVIQTHNTGVDIKINADGQNPVLILKLGNTLPILTIHWV